MALLQYVSLALLFCFFIDPSSLLAATRSTLFKASQSTRRAPTSAKVGTIHQGYQKTKSGGWRKLEPRTKREVGDMVKGWRKTKSGWEPVKAKVGDRVGGYQKISKGHWRPVGQRVESKTAPPQPLGPAGIGDIREGYQKVAKGRWRRQREEVYLVSTSLEGKGHQALAIAKVRNDGRPGRIVNFFDAGGEGGILKPYQQEPWRLRYAEHTKRSGKGLWKRTNLRPDAVRDAAKEMAPFRSNYRLRENCCYTHAGHLARSAAKASNIPPDSIRHVGGRARPDVAKAFYNDIGVDLAPSRKVRQERGQVIEKMLKKRQADQVARKHVTSLNPDMATQVAQPPLKLTRKTEKVRRMGRAQFQAEFEQLSKDIERYDALIKRQVDASRGAQAQFLVPPHTQEEVKLLTRLGIATSPDAKQLFRDGVPLTPGVEPEVLHAVVGGISQNRLQKFKARAADMQRQLDSSQTRFTYDPAAKLSKTELKQINEQAINQVIK